MTDDRPTEAVPYYHYLEVPETPYYPHYLVDSTGDTVAYVTLDDAGVPVTQDLTPDLPGELADQEAIAQENARLAAQIAEENARIAAENALREAAKTDPLAGLKVQLIDARAEHEHLQAETAQIELKIANLTDLIGRLEAPLTTLAHTADATASAFTGIPDLAPAPSPSPIETAA